MISTQETRARTLPRKRQAERVTQLKGAVSRLAIQASLWIWAILVVFPFVWMIYTSFKTDQEIFFSPWSLPQTPR